MIKDTTEIDLWAFDDGVQADEKRLEPLPRLGRAAGIPIPRISGKMKKLAVGGLAKSEESSVPQDQEAGEFIQINFSKKHPKSQSMYHSKVGSEFDELEGVNEAEAREGILEAEPVLVREVARRVSANEKAVPETRQPVARPELEQDEFSPPIRENAVPISLRPHLNLSKVERVGLAALLGVLLVGGGVIYFKTIHDLPSGSGFLQENHFPVKGEHLTILSGSSYWRAPIMDGENTETFRRGTQLVPVINLTLSGGPGAIRVIFRNSDGEVIGDAVTRSIPTGTTLEVAATAGFEDVGMHAAYRTGQSKPWTMQVYEAPSLNSTGSAFKKLFELNVSTDRR